MTQSRRLEARALQFTIFGTLGMALLGLGFALVTKSEAILLDGFFSLISFVVALITRMVSGLVLRPGDDRFPFGYAIFEPMLTLSRGLLVTAVSLFALISAIAALFTGGRPISAGVAIVYALIAAVGCFGLAVLLSSLAKRSRSPLVMVEAKSWMIDGWISAGVAIAFLIVRLTQTSPIATFAPYADPVVVILLVVFTIAIPVKIIRDSWRQLIGYRLTSEKMQLIHTVVAKTFEPWPTLTWQFRAIEIGRWVYVQVYGVVSDQSCKHLSQQDELREQLYGALSEQYEHLELDVVFTQQAKWANK